MPFKTVYGVSDVEVAGFVEGSVAVKSWCQKFSAAVNGGWLSGSRLDKARILCRFFKWLRMEKDVYLSADELLDRQLRLRQSASVKDRQWLLNLVLQHTRDNSDFNDYADMTRYGMFTCIKSFFGYHEVTLTMAKGVYGKKRKKKNHRKQFTLAKAKEIMGRMSQRDRTISLIQLQSGMAIGDVLDKFNYMYFSQVKPQLDQGRPRLKVEFDERKGNGTWYFTFISTDAIHELRKWLVERKQTVKTLLADGRHLDQRIIDGEPIFITRFGTPLRPKQFIKNFHRKYNGKVTSHMFRKLFESEAKVPDRGINPEYVKFFMGHVPQMDEAGGTYDRNIEIREEIFEREYAKLEPYTNIWSGVQVEPLSEEDREWMEVSNMLRKLLSDEEKQRRFLKFVEEKL